MAKLKNEQKAISERWRAEKDDMNKLQYLKEEIERVNLEVQQAERDYDLNRYRRCYTRGFKRLLSWVLVHCTLA